MKNAEMSEPVTVVIPTYNRAGYIERAVRSVTEQAYPSVELLIVDDGSSDDTRQVIDRLKNQVTIPLRYIYQENRGAASARNTGIQASGTELICFLDSDDRFLPEKISTQVNQLNSSGRLISHTRETWFRRGKHLNQKKKHQQRDGYLFQDCLRMCVVGMSTVMVRRELFDRFGLFDESLPCCEDYDYWLRVSTREMFQLVPEPLTIKDGGREDQLSVIYRTGMDRYRIQSIVNLLEQCSLSEVQYALAVAELERKCRIYGNGCLKHNREEEGRYYLGLPGGYTGK